MIQILDTIVALCIGFLVFLTPFGIILGIIFGIIASKEKDIQTKKRNKCVMWLSLGIPIGGLFFILIIWGLVSVIAHL